MQREIETKLKLQFRSVLFWFISGWVILLVILYKKKMYWTELKNKLETKNDNQSRWPSPDKIWNKMIAFGGKQIFD